MTKRLNRMMAIEADVDFAEVDFIDECFVTLTVADGKLTINVKATHGPNESTWDEHDFEVTLPKKPPPMKTYEEWNGSGVNLDKYLTPGDEVDQAMFDYFLEVVPPASFGSRHVQIGEACDHSGPGGQPTFDTIVRHEGRWIYLGRRILRDLEIRKEEV